MNQSAMRMVGVGGRLDNTSMYVRRYEVPLMEYGAYRLHKALLLYVPPILLVLGTVGNALSVIILTRKGLRKHSTYFYLAVLSAADTVVLYVGLLRLWIGELTGEDVRDRSNWACKLISLVGYTVSDYSGWLIIAVTVERYIAVCHPLKAPTACSRNKAIRIVVGILVVLFLVNAHFFWTVEVVDIVHGGEAIPMCQGGANFSLLIDTIWPWVDAIIYSFLPFVSILVLNALIGREVLRARNHRRTLQSEGRKHAVTPFTATDTGRVTVMLFGISFAFLVLTLPMNLANISVRFLAPREPSIDILINFRLVRTVTELLMYLNHSINFVLYCAMGQKFRDQLIWMLHPNRRPTGPLSDTASHHRMSNPLVELRSARDTRVVREMTPLTKPTCV